MGDTGTLARAGGLHGFVAVVRVELALRLRDPSMVVLIAAVLAISALLVPPPAASYAVVTINGSKPLMSGATALVAAAIVLGTIMLPVFSLVLDIGHARDGRMLLDRLQLTSPARQWILAAGRVAANALFMLGSVALCLTMVSSTIAARSLGVPPLSAVIVFLLIVVPVSLCSVLLGALLDRILVHRNGRKAAAALLIWFSTVGASVAMRHDLFGVSYLRNITESRANSEPSFSVGLISTRGLPVMPWTEAPVSRDLLEGRVVLLAALLLATVAMVPVARLRIEPSAPPGAASSGFRGADRYTVPRLRAPDSVRVPGLPGSLPVVVGRWLARSPLVASLLAVALLLALAATGSPGLSFAAALLVPVAVVTGMSTAEARVAGTLERTTASLLRPRPALGFGWQLALLAIVPTLPSLLHVSTLQAGTAALAIVTVAMWLTWTHRCISRPVLGVSIVALLWYLDVLNHPPAPFDIFGLWHADVRTFLLALAASAAVSLAVWWHDRVGPAPRRALSPDRS